MIILWLRKIAEAFSEPARKEKIYIFLLCLFCSAIFWLFITISRENRTEFTQIISFGDLPDGTMVLDQSDSQIRYSAQTSGLRLFASAISRRHDTLQIGLPDMSRQIRDDGDLFFITSPALTGLLSQQSDVLGNIFLVRPDTVFVRLTRRIEKKVAVVLQADISYERRFGLYGDTKLLPDSVVISGPESMVDTISHVYTRHAVLNNLSQHVEMMLEITPPGPGGVVDVRPRQVSLFLPVEEFTESSVEVSLAVKCPDSLNAHEAGRLRLFPDRTTLFFLVALKDYQRIDPVLFNAYVECPSSGVQQRQLPVFVGESPEFVKMGAIRPATVDFLIMN